MDAGRTACNQFSYTILNREVETEQQLLQAVFAGESGAGRRLYARYSGQLMAIALRYMGNGEDAADVLQDAFVKILTHIRRFDYRGEGSLCAWMGRITVNEALQSLRQRKWLFHDEPLAEEPPDEAPDVALVPPEVLTRMLGDLPEGYRTVLNLFVFEQMSHREIARQLGIKESTSASQYFRAKRLLAKSIQEYLRDRSQEL